jgi:hypothetical protein
MPTKNKLSIYRRIAYGVIAFSVLSLIFLFSSALLFPQLGTNFNKISPIQIPGVNSPAPSSIGAIPVNYSNTKSVSVQNNEVPPIVVDQEYKHIPTTEVNTILLYRDIGDKKQHIKVTVLQNLTGDPLRKISNLYLANAKQTPRYIKYFKTGPVYGIRAIATTAEDKKMLIYNFLADAETTHVVLISRDISPGEDQSKLASEMVEETTKFLTTYHFDLGTRINISELSTEAQQAIEINRKDYEANKDK